MTELKRLGSDKKNSLICWRINSNKESLMA